MAYVIENHTQCCPITETQSPFNVKPISCTFQFNWKCMSPVMTRITLITNKNFESRPTCEFIRRNFLRSKNFGVLESSKLMTNCYVALALLENIMLHIYYYMHISLLYTVIRPIIQRIPCWKTDNCLSLLHDYFAAFQGEVSLAPSGYPKTFIQLSDMDVQSCISWCTSYLTCAGVIVTDKDLPVCWYFTSTLATKDFHPKQELYQIKRICPPRANGEHCILLIFLIAVSAKNDKNDNDNDDNNNNKNDNYNNYNDN